MQISTKNKSIIAAIAAVATISVMSSCSNDSPSSFNALSGQGFGAVEASTPAKAAKHKIGEVVKRHIEGYGDINFTCISSKSPFYFVHVSDTICSPAEMDAMHYQQNRYAVDEKMFNTIADIIVKDWAPYYIKDEGDFTKEKIQKFKDEFERTFSKVFARDIFGESTRHISVETKEVWIRNSAHEYPHGHIEIVYDKGSAPQKYVSQTFSGPYFLAASQRLMFAIVEE